jgi:diguanylate cyclase (GGDEF)-like protein
MRPDDLSSFDLLFPETDTEFPERDPGAWGSVPVLTGNSVVQPALEALAEPKSLAETHTNEVQYFVAEPRRTGRACLLQIYPAGVHAELFRLHKPRTVIGRDPGCDVALEDNSVSRQHLAITEDDQGCLLQDLGSRNGTFVDDRLTRECRRLTGGELIRVGGTILKFLASMDEEAQYHAVVHELMVRDPLTNAFNRSYLMSSLDKSLPKCLRTGEEFSIILIDIDHFKRVNDSFGHLTGDEVLRIFAERLRSVLRPENLLYRLGGEEFLIVLEHVGLNEAIRIADRLRVAVADRAFQTQSGMLRVTCSLGVASLSAARASSVDELLKSADERLYAAKKGGRNCVKSHYDQETCGR